MSKSKVKKLSHDWHIDRILHSREVQHKLGIESVIWGSNELVYWKNNQIYCELDVLLFTGQKYERPFFVVEYKSLESCYQTAYEQLDKYEEFVKNMLNADCYKLFVYSDFLYRYISNTPKKR